MDEDKLEAMREVLQPWGMRSVMVMFRGRKAWEWHEAGVDQPAAIYSCTKSVLSALIGIAIDKGLIQSEEESIASYFASHNSSLQDKLSRIRIRHLLAMTPGFSWPDFDKPYNEMVKEDDWLKFILERPIVHEPGTAFTYNSGGSHLLSAILTKATGRSTLDFARDNLFEPLGIQPTAWSELGGIHEGGTGLQMTAEDLAKIGVLYANRGIWENDEIITEHWIDRSTSVAAKGLVNYKPSIYGSYGYHWWISADQPEGVPDYYFAFGYGGQYLAIAPAQAAVVVIRKQLTGRNQAIWSRKLLHDYIFSALRPIC